MPAAHLANERTRLSWSRTGIAVVGLGCVVARFALGGKSVTALSTAFGVALVVCGGAAGRGAPRLSARGGGHHPARRSLVTDQRDRGRRGARAVRHHRLRLPDCCGVTWWAVVRTMVAFGYAVVEARRTLMDRAGGDTCVVWGERGRTPSQHPAGGKP